MCQGFVCQLVIERLHFMCSQFANDVAEVVEGLTDVLRKKILKSTDGW
jgi:hypothetical protein